MFRGFFITFEDRYFRQSLLNYKKSGFATPPAAEVRSNIAFLMPCAFLKSYAFQKILHGNIINFFTVQECKFLYSKKDLSFPTSLFFYPGSFLLSRAVTSQVSSALQSLTTVFGMGTGVTSVLSPPNGEGLYPQN